MKDTYTINETYRLPSKGKLYDGCPERITLRSMTTEEEMRRLSHTENPYKTLCDIIDACIVEDIPISTYDMCLGDYQFLLYKLRVVTYGDDYLNSSLCPFCGNVNTQHINLDTLPSKEFNAEDFSEDALTIKLPRTGKVIKITYTTPRMLDAVEEEKKEYDQRVKENDLDLTPVFKLKRNIKYVDGQHYDSAKLEGFIRKLPAMDLNILQQTIDNLDDKVGVDTLIITKCSNPKCKLEYPSSFRITSEFFRPRI